jgi:hypothetical protein
MKKLIILVIATVFASPLIQTTDIGQVAHDNPAKTNVQLVKGIGGLLNIETLPFLKHEVQVRFTGSIAKSGDNADCDWWLYQDQNGEWVIFDVDGPGCIYNFYNHRGYPGYARRKNESRIDLFDAPETYYRFYFDGSKDPQFVIKASDFGTKSGFEAPLTDMYINWVKRTWFPMYFQKGCKVTTSARLLTPPGGWGTIIYHSYATKDGVHSFSESTATKEHLRQVLKSTGADPKPTAGNQVKTGTFMLKPNSAVTVLDLQETASISSCKIKIEPYNPDMLKLIWIKLFFDDFQTPCVNVPIGAFFGNEAGQGTTETIMQGLEVKCDSNRFVSAKGYNYFPMPYWKGARMVIEYGAGSEPVTVTGEFQIRPPQTMLYPKGACGYFRAAYRNPYKPEDDNDVEFAQLSGTGHMVSGTFSSNIRASESDFQFYIDGCSTPQLSSDGSESWAGYGWGFLGLNSFPLGCQDKFQDGAWCETRLLVGDFYPFYNQLNVRLENLYGVGPANRNYRGAVFYYGVDAPTLLMTDRVDVGDIESERLHNYHIDKPFSEGLLSLISRYEGCSYDYKKYTGGMVKGELTDQGRAFTGSSEFKVAIDKNNKGVRLRRRSDQYYGRQRAKVYVDGKLVTERTWYHADRNQQLRWLEDEFDIPSSYTRGKDSITLRLEYVSADVMAVKKLTGDKIKTATDKCLAEGRFGKGLDCSADPRPTVATPLYLKGSFTVDFWVKLPPETGIQSLLSCSRVSNQSGAPPFSLWEIMTDNGLLAVYSQKYKEPISEATKNRNELNVKTLTNIADGKWHYVAMTLDGQSIQLYADGVLVTKIDIDGENFTQENGSLMFGRRETRAGDYYGCSGILDEIRVSNKILDVSKVPNTQFTSDDNTVALWHFDRIGTGGCIANAVTDGSPIQLFSATTQTVFASDIPAPAWTEYYYWIFSYVPLL